jgi:hypothetical protein
VTVKEFRRSASGSAATPPAGISAVLSALWHDARGDWARAHELAQGDPTPEGSWVHGYLHRKEGDAANAHYWYLKAGRPIPKMSLEEEWTDIADNLLTKRKL